MSDDLVKRAKNTANQLEEWVQKYTGINKRSTEANLIRLLADRIEELEEERDELRSAIFGSNDYASDLRNGNFREMAETLHAAQKGGLARAKTAEAKLAKAVDGLTQIERTYYQEAANPSPETIRRMSARMNGIARDTQDALAEINGDSDTCNS